MIASKSRREAEKEELLKRVCAWETTKPSAPYTAEPEYEDSGLLSFGIAYPFLGFLLGIGMSAQDQLLGEVSLWIATAPIWMSLAFLAGGIILSLIVDGFLWLSYRPKRKAWEEYELTLKAWRTKGREEFMNHLHDLAVNRRVHSF